VQTLLKSSRFLNATYYHLPMIVCKKVEPRVVEEADGFVASHVPLDEALNIETRFAELSSELTNLEVTFQIAHF
jgi:hypothetical protein